MKRALAAGFLARDNQQGEPSSTNRARRQLERSDDESRDSTLHVTRATSIEPSIGYFTGEGVARPGPSAQRYGIDVTYEDERAPVGMTSNPRDHACPIGRKLMQAD